MVIVAITFEDAVTELATEDGINHLLTIPGVWECVSEYYNNAAITLMESESEEDVEDDEENHA